MSHDDTCVQVHFLEFLYSSISTNLHMFYNAPTFLYILYSASPPPHCRDTNDTPPKLPTQPSTSTDTHAKQPIARQPVGTCRSYVTHSPYPAERHTVVTPTDFNVTASNNTIFTDTQPRH